jgi:hypothetical protein
MVEDSQEAHKKMFARTVLSMSLIVNAVFLYFHFWNKVDIGECREAIALSRSAMGTLSGILGERKLSEDELLKSLPVSAVESSCNPSVPLEQPIIKKPLANLAFESLCFRFDEEQILREIDFRSRKLWKKLDGVNRE